jgi:hypothetical protein
MTDLLVDTSIPYTLQEAKKRPVFVAESRSIAAVQCGQAVKRALAGIRTSMLRTSAHSQAKGRNLQANHQVNGLKR